MPMLLYNCPLHIFKLLLTVHPEQDSYLALILIISKDSCPGGFISCPGEFISCPGGFVSCPGAFVTCPGGFISCAGEFSSIPLLGTAQCKLIKQQAAHCNQLYEVQ